MECPPTFRIFACQVLSLLFVDVFIDFVSLLQNRCDRAADAGLPQSFLNRFTKARSFSLSCPMSVVCYLSAFAVI